MLPRKRGGSDGEFIRRVLFVVGIAALAAALYQLSDVVLLIFGAILVGVVIRALARPIQNRHRPRIFRGGVPAPGIRGLVSVDQ